MTLTLVVVHLNELTSLYSVVYVGISAFSNSNPGINSS
ncbi:MAG: hypothetical protein ACJAY8_001094, partial [Sphingobacteriales bacterium]